jgi:hypothetical protein
MLPDRSRDVPVRAHGLLYSRGMVLKENPDILAQRPPYGIQKQLQDLISGCLAQGRVEADVGFDVALGVTNGCLQLLQTVVNELQVLFGSSLGSQVSDLDFERVAGFYQIIQPRVMEADEKVERIPQELGAGSGHKGTRTRTHL